MDKENLIQLVLLVTDQLCSLKYRLEKVLKYNFPSDGPVKLTELLIKICHLLLRPLCRLGSDLEHNVIETSLAEREVHIITRIVKRLAKYIRFVETARIEYVPIEIVGPIEQIIKKISPEARVIVRPQSAYMYEYREIIHSLVEVCGRATKRVPIERIFIGCPQKIPIFNFPTVEKENIFSLSSLGHEIGHFIYDVNILPTKIYSAMPRADYVKKIEGIVADKKRIEGKKWLSKLQDYRSRFRSDIETERSNITRAAESWFKELASDILSVKVFGPASFFSFVMSGLVDYPLDYDPALSLFWEYPSPRKRLKYMFKEVEPYFDFSNNKETEKYKGLIKNFNEMIENYRNLIESNDEDQALIEMRNIDEPGIKKSTELLNDIVIPAVEALDVEKITNGYRYTRKKFQDEIFELYLKFKDDILPSEVSKKEGGKFEPARWVSILNAGWLYYLNSEKFKRVDVFVAAEDLDRYDEYSSEEYFHQRQELAKFALRAIEVSQIHQRFIDEKEHR